MDRITRYTSTMINVLVAGVLLIAAGYGCSEDDAGTGPGSNTASGPTFLIASRGSGDSLAAGLYLLSNSTTGPQFTFVTEYRPTYTSIEYADMNSGRVAVRVDKSLVPEGESGLIYFDVANPTDIRWAPIPDAPEDHHYTLANYRPQVLTDGRIAYPVVLNTDNIYDDAHWGMIAIYNPSSGDVELSGNPSSFVLAQPEKGSDTEGGSCTGHLVLSPDDRYVYTQVYGYGTNMGTYHVDHKFTVRYEIGSPGSYERIVHSTDRPTAMTADGKYLILSGDGLHRVDVEKKTDVKVDDYSNIFNVGQVSRTGSKMFKIWRGSGLGQFDMSTVPPGWIQVIQGDEINDSYRGLGHGAQYSMDESRVYFTASTDYYTNYKTPLRIFSSPITELNSSPDSITTIPVEYCTSFFMLLAD